jgi:Domain of unknown function (DUF4124)
MVFAIADGNLSPSAVVQEKTLRSPGNCVIFYYQTACEGAFMLRLVVLAACIFLFSVSSARADFYRWVDKDGKEFFTNDLKQIPQEYRAHASTIKPDESRVSVGEQPIVPRKTSVKSIDHKDKYGRNEEFWRKRAEKYRHQLRDYQHAYDLLARKEKDEENNPKIVTSKKKKALTSRERKKAQLETKIVKTKKILDVDLPEEARRADAYPGWLRE